MRQSGTGATERRGAGIAAVAALVVTLAAGACGSGAPPADGVGGSAGAPAAAPSIRPGSFSAGGTLFDSVLASGAVGGAPTDTTRALAAQPVDSAPPRPRR